MISANGIDCTPCVAGRRPNAKQTSCDLCPLDRYSSDGVSCKECWENAKEIPDRTWCTCKTGSHDNWTVPEGTPGAHADCVDDNECAVSNGGCDESTVCTNLNPGRVCGVCPPGYNRPIMGAPYYSGDYTIFAGLTYCYEPPVDEDTEAVMAPELTLFMQVGQPQTPTSIRALIIHTECVGNVGT